VTKHYKRRMPSLRASVAVGALLLGAWLAPSALYGNAWVNCPCVGIYAPGECPPYDCGYGAWGSSNGKCGLEEGWCYLIDGGDFPYHCEWYYPHLSCEQA
jgi:hypothetical protein